MSAPPISRKYRRRGDDLRGSPDRQYQDVVDKFALFTDVSVNPQLRIGVGACLLLPLPFLETPPQNIDRGELSAQLHYRRFTATSSTRLELQTVLWGLELYRTLCPVAERGALQLYTDSSCVVGLPGRRARLEGSAYLAKRSGRLLANAPLYVKLYAVSDELNFEIVKVAGHPRASTHDSIQRLFAVVDQGARRALKDGAGCL